MFFRFFGFCAVTAALFLLTGCGPDERNNNGTGDSVKVSMSDTGDAELKAVFNMQIQALKGKNSKEYLTTIRVSGLDSINALHYFESVTQLYDLDYLVRDFRVLRQDERTAEVEVEMEVRKVNGPAFEDHVSVTRHILGKTPEGKWVILESHEMKFTKLDAAPGK